MLSFRKCRVSKVSMTNPFFLFFFFFFNDTATTEIYTLSLHDALPIPERPVGAADTGGLRQPPHRAGPAFGDRKSTRLNSSHSQISYAVFCLKKKKKRQKADLRQQKAKCHKPF